MQKTARAPMQAPRIDAPSRELSAPGGAAREAAEAARSAAAEQERRRLAEIKARFEQDDLASGGCLYPETRTEGGVVVVDVRGDHLVETARPTVEGVDSVQRAIPAGDGWALLGYGEIIILDEAGTVAHRVSIA